MAKKGGIFPDQPDSGVQGLFDQAGRSTPTAPTKPVDPSADDRADRGRFVVPEPHGSPPKQSKRKSPLRRGINAAHLIAIGIAFVGLIAGGIFNTSSKYDGPSATQLAKIASPAAPGGSSSPSRSSSTERPAVETMKIVRSGSPIANGVYVAAPSDTRGAGTRTVLEFALTGRGQKQHVVYVAGSALRDASCDGEKPDARMVGLTIYDDEAASKVGQISDRAIKAGFKGGEAIRGTATSSSVIKGRLELPGYSACPAGGSFSFRARRSADPKGRVARLIIAADRTAAKRFSAIG